MNSKVLDFYPPDTMRLVDPVTLEPPTWTKWKMENDSRPQNRKRKQDLSKTLRTKSYCKKANKKDLMYKMKPEDHTGNPTYQQKIYKSQKSKNYREKQKSKLVTAMARLAQEKEKRMQEEKKSQALAIKLEGLLKQNWILGNENQRLQKEFCAIKEELESLRKSRELWDSNDGAIVNEILGRF